MKILTRYILREFCVPLFYCLTGFISIYLLFELFGSFSQLMAAKPGFLVAAEYLAGYFAPYFQWMAPACLMLATLYTMWRFCRHSEIVAMRASGIGFFTIVKPILAMSVLMACAVAWVNESYVPRNSPWATRFKMARFDAAETSKAKGILFINEKVGRRWQAEMPRTLDAAVLENVRVEDIAKCTAGTFEWIADGRKSAGSKAQDWKPLVPELVHGEEGNMTLAYGQIALLNTVLLARHESEQDKEIRELKEKLNVANRRINELENRLRIS